jgi:glutamate N-acetyltransferase/amino-acid N-acetyltransferase
VEAPVHATELDGGLPQGFRAAGVAAGVKEAGLDVGLLVADAPGTTSAARFTQSGTQAAPVLLCLDGCDLAHIRAVVVNSGNANAATGLPGLEHAAAMQRAAATASWPRNGPYFPVSRP